MLCHAHILFTFSEISRKKEQLYYHFHREKILCFSKMQPENVDLSVLRYYYVCLSVAPETGCFKQLSWGCAGWAAKNSHVTLQPLCAIWDLGFWDTCDVFHFS